MTNTEQRTKDQTYWALLDAAIELDIKKGHLKWTLSDLSRKSNITRSLIYYYFGKDKQDILKEAIKLIGEEFIGLNEKRMELWQKGLFAESMKEARKFYENAPYLPLFIMENRSKPNEIGDAIRTLEVGFEAKLKTFFPNCDETQITSIFTIYWGLAYSPKISDASINQVVQLMITNFR